MHMNTKFLNEPHASMREKRRQRLFELALEAVDGGIQPFDREHLLIRQRPDCGPSPHRPGLIVAQQTPEYAVALMESGRDPELGVRIIDRLLDYQCVDPNRYDYGNWLWVHGWERAVDTNAVGMILPALAHVMLHHAPLLDDALRDRLLRAFELAGHGLLGMRFSTAYTNMHVRRMLGLFYVAHFTNNERLRELAYWDWVEWTQEIVLHSFNEYLSPTYTGTNLSALELLAEAPGVTPEFQQHVQQIITILWAQMLDWYHPPSTKLIGPFARCYDPRLLPNGPDIGVSQLFWREFEGLEPEPLPSTVCVRWAASRWTMPEEIRQQLSNRRWPHRAEERTPFWPGDHRSCYQTELFALGVKLRGENGAPSATPLFLAWKDTHVRRTLYLRDEMSGVSVHHATQADHRVLGACQLHQPQPNENPPKLPVFWGLHPPRPLPETVTNAFHLGVCDQIVMEPTEGIVAPNVPVRWQVGPIACAWQWLPRNPKNTEARLIRRDGEWVLEISMRTHALPPGDGEAFAYAFLVNPRGESTAMSPIEVSNDTAGDWSLRALLDGDEVGLCVPLTKPAHHQSRDVLVTEETYFGVSPFVNVSP